MPESELLKATLHYLLDLHWAVIPLGGDKKPVAVTATKRFEWETYQHKLPTEAQVRQWFTHYSVKGVGVVCGPISGIFVLDFEKSDGLETLLAWGEKGWKLPDGPTVKTGGGGLHAYFRLPEGTNFRNMPKLGQGVELRAHGCQCAAPPSLHPSGTTYQWYPGESPDDLPLPESPGWLLDLQKNGPNPQASTSTPPDGGSAAWRLLLGPIPEGRRNQDLTRVAGWLHLYHPAPVVRALLLVINLARCIPPLVEEEVEQIATSVTKYPTPGVPGHPRAVVADFTRLEATNG